jgi:bifunctional enzyme CysN/CysC/sulfate adenylyltransferase subunit 1
VTHELKTVALKQAIAEHRWDALITGIRRVFWLGTGPLSISSRYRLKLATQDVECQVVALGKIVDAATLDSDATARTARSRQP